MENLGGRLTTVTGRVCLDMPRSRTARREAPLHDQDGLVRIPDPIVGLPGVVSRSQGRPLSVMAFTVRDGRITALDILTDPERLARLDLSAAEA
ncbi:hypothetical protein ACFWP3_32295 [Streptomyces sp. NPDC058525]|uniref:hypothetical protein n=1 Tax=Streptomyces sp. NPDC058525 TaxID=3346538 RepID=UPI00365A721D